MSEELLRRLRSGHHNADLVTVGGVTHDGRCLVAADALATQAAEIERLRAELAMSKADERWQAVADEVGQKLLAAEAERDALRERINCAADMAEDMWRAPQGSLWNYGTTPSARDRVKWEGVKETAQDLLALLDPDRYRSALAGTEGGE